MFIIKQYNGKYNNVVLRYLFETRSNTKAENEHNTKLATWKRKNLIKT